MKKLNGLNGFTLLEVIIASAIFAIILSATFTALSMGQNSFSDASVHSSLEKEATVIMDSLLQYLPECKIATPPQASNQHALMTIQVPVSVTGSYWSATGTTINWGANDQLGWTMTYQFNQKQIFDETLTPHEDYNGDGDYLDKYEEGQIQLVFKNAAGTVQDTINLGRGVVTIYNSRDADIDGDGQSDPIFQIVNNTGAEDIVNGNRVKLKIVLIKQTYSEGKIIALVVQGEKALLNPQD
jgi:prepilin-type N-terminal cleavage/methylation domain-containing protein